MATIRPSFDVTFMRIALELSRRTTCARRGVGCVLVNEKRHIIGCGYNGSPAGSPHCTDNPCEGAQCSSGEGLDLCQALHAEQNALIQCANSHHIHTCYVTTAPCMSCTKLLANTGCKEIVYLDTYATIHSTASYWEKLGRQIRQLSEV